MPPTTVLTYQKQNHYDDVLSISTNEIQKAQPTSFCDDIANQFYMHCLQPLVELVPPAITTEDRLIERALELGRRAVIDGSDVNIVRRNIHLKENRNTMLSLHCQMEERQQSSQAIEEVRLTGADEESHNSDDSDSFVITDKPKKRVEALSSTGFVSVAKKPSRMTVPMAIRKMSLHTVEQCTKKRLIDVKTKRPNKIAVVNRKGFNVKPKLFCGSKTESNDTIHDDTTSSSSYPSESSCYDKELVVTEVTAREFNAPRENKEKNENMGGLPPTPAESNHVDNIPTLHCNEGTLAYDKPANQSQFQDSKPIVAAARETSYSVGEVKRCVSSRFEIEESPRRTVYSEDAVEKHVAKLMHSTNSSPEHTLNESNCSLDMKALMHSISENCSLVEYKQETDIQPTSGLDEGEDSTNMCEFQLKNHGMLSSLDNSSQGKQSTASSFCSAVPMKAVETPLPSVIAFRKARCNLISHPLSPVSFDEPNRSESNVAQDQDDVASNSNEAVRQEHEHDFGNFRSSSLLKRDHAPTCDDIPTISHSSHSKLDRLRMVRSARLSEKIANMDAPTSAQQITTIPANTQERCHKVTWAENLPKYFHNATETHYCSARRSQDIYGASVFSNAQILKSRSDDDASDEMGSAKFTSHSESNRLMRLRMAHPIPYQQRLTEGQPSNIRTAFNRHEEKEPKSSSYPFNDDTKCEEPEPYQHRGASSIREQMNRHAQQLHQKRYSSSVSQRANIMEAQIDTLEKASPTTGNLLGSANRIRSFQKKIDMKK